MTHPLSVLIVEDEPLILMMVEDFVDALGHTVAASASSVASGVKAVEAGGFDVAILDLRLTDGASWPVADALADRGIPYLLATGGYVEAPPARHAAAPVLAKPFTMDGVGEALQRIAPAR
jgi:CheY-like chemotaxis protein